MTPEQRDRALALAAPIHLRMVFEEDDHPRGEKGSTTGGQFVKKSAQAAATSAQKSATAAKRRPAASKPAPKKAAPVQQHAKATGDMGYNSLTGRGTGYGRPDGDPRVKQLQQALNRLGLRDDHGKPLKLDGRFGPETFQAVREAQKRMGDKGVIGRVTPELLDRISTTKRLPGKRKAGKSCTCREDALLAAELRDFNPSLHPHSPADGKFVETGGGARGAIKDVLKLADRIDLAPGEELAGSDKVSGDDGTVRLALTHRDGQPSLRVGVGGYGFGARDDEAGPWNGGPGRVAAINAERTALRDERDRLGEEYDDLSDSGADPARLATVGARLDELADMDLGDVAASGATARLDGPQVAALRTSLTSAAAEAERRAAELWAPSDEIEHAAQARQAEIETEIAQLRAQLDPLEDEREPLRLKYMASLEGGPPISAEDDAELDRLTEVTSGYYERIGALREEHDSLNNLDYSGTPETDVELASGVVPGTEWGDVHYEFWGTDDTDNRWRLKLAVHPHDAANGWVDMYESVPEHQLAQFDPAEARRLLKQLDKMSVSGA